MDRSDFAPTIDGEARLLLLIDAFSGGAANLEGRTKLAKLDFFLRYPSYLRRAVSIRGHADALPDDSVENDSIDTQMVRYRYGPWDPSYFAILGRLIGKGLIEPVPGRRGVGYRASESGCRIARALRTEPAWSDVVQRIAVLRKRMNLSGNTLKQFIYENFPEVAQARWGDQL